MEANSDMGQVGYVTHKLTELEISKEKDKDIVEGTLAAEDKKTEACYAEKADGISTTNDDGAENDREEHFIYSGNGMNLVLEDTENKNKFSKGKYEKGFSGNTFQSECRKEQKMARKIELPKCEIRESIGEILTSSDDANKHEVNTNQIRCELPMNLHEEKVKDINEIDINVSSSDSEHELEKWVELYPSECEQNVNVVSLVENGIKCGLSFMPPERDNEHHLANVWNPPEFEEGKEIAKQVLPSEYEDNEKNHFMYCGVPINAVLNDEYSYENDFISSKWENNLGRSMFQNDCKKNQEMAVKRFPSRYEEEDIGAISISLEIANKHEANIKEYQCELSMKFHEEKLEDKNEKDLNLIFSKPENECSKITALSPKSEKKVDQINFEENGIRNDSSFSPPGHENAHNVAMICTPTECEIGTENAKKFLSPVCEENEIKEHFIYSAHGMNLVLDENENIYKVPKDYNTRKCAKELSFKVDSKQEQEIASKLMSSKCETGEDIGAGFIASKSANNQELKMNLDRNEPTLNLFEDKHDIDNKQDLNSSESGNEIGECMNLSPSESVEKRIKKNLNFTPPERENSHDLAMILTPFECKAVKGIAKDMSSTKCKKHPKIANCSFIHPECVHEQLVSIGDSSPECNEDIGTFNFVCNECKCQREPDKDLSCFKVQDSQETSAYLVSSECDDAKKYIANVKSNELKKKVIFLKNPMSGDSKSQQDTAKKVACTNYESKKMSTMNIQNGKYARDNKTGLNGLDKFRKETSLCQPEFKFGRTNSSTSHTSNEEKFQTPSDSLADKIVHQAEFYFSDFNILKNNFLLKHIRRNKEGFLSLKLVSSFRKIKALTKDWRAVAYSLEGSKLLELNAEKTKVRRIEKIPKLRDTSFGKTVVVFNLPSKHQTSNDIKELFSKFGTIVSAEIITLKSPTYNIYHKRCRYFNKELSSNAFGVVEFEKYEFALAAIKDEESHLPKENEMKVVSLMPPKYRSDPVNSRSSSSTFLPNFRRSQGRFKPRSEMQKGRQVDDAKLDDIQARPPIPEKFYRGNYQPRNAWKPRSYTDVQGKLPNERIIGKVDEVEKNSQVRKQLKDSNTLNVNPVHQQQRYPGRFYPGFRYHGARADV